MSVGYQPRNFSDRILRRSPRDGPTDDHGADEIPVDTNADGPAMPDSEFMVAMPLPDKLVGLLERQRNEPKIRGQKTQSTSATSRELTPTFAALSDYLNGCGRTDQNMQVGSF